MDLFTVSGEVFSPGITSTSFIISAGIKKCNPITLSGVVVAPAILVILNVEVLVARIVSLLIKLSS